MLNVWVFLIFLEKQKTGWKTSNWLRTQKPSGYKIINNKETKAYSTNKTKQTNKNLLSACPLAFRKVSRLQNIICKVLFLLYISVILLLARLICFSLSIIFINFQLTCLY